MSFHAGARYYEQERLESLSKSMHSLHDPHSSFEPPAALPPSHSHRSELPHSAPSESLNQAVKDANASLHSSLLDEE